MRQYTLFLIGIGAFIILSIALLYRKRKHKITLDIIDLGVKTAKRWGRRLCLGYWCKVPGAEFRVLV